MDEDRTGETVYGKPIISITEAVSLGVSAIVIIARAANVRIIYRRIENDCRKYAIAVYDIAGNRIDAGQTENKSLEKYENIIEQTAKIKIDAAEVVSFDIFDTLLMRRVLYPRDIFALTGKKLGLGESFAKLRTEAELSLYAEGRQPNIYDIYDRMGGISPDTEIEVETQNLIKRECVVDLLNYAQSYGKDIYLVSDMYLPKEVIKHILDGLGVNIELESIIISCDAGISKPGGLFEILRSKVGKKRILHVGDSFEADVQAAWRQGVDDTFQIESALTMLEDGCGSEILKFDSTFITRAAIGEFIAKALNNPFLFASTQGKFKAASSYELSISFIASFIVRLFVWVAKGAAELNLDTVLLSSRDGFLLEKIYSFYKGKCSLVPMKYFYTSRAAAVLAGLEDDEDIAEAIIYAFAGTPEEMLKKRFGLNPEEVLPRDSREGPADFILRHKSVILRNANTARQNYLEYIDGLGLPKGAKIGFFDFVSTGTCQHSLMKFSGLDLYGLYCAKLNSQNGNQSELPVEAMFGTVSPIDRPYHFLDNYFVLESALASFEPTLSGFNDNGKPLFFPESRNERQLEELRKIQRGVMDYLQETQISLKQFNDIDIGLVDEIFHCLSPQYCETETDCFCGGQMADEFSNRAFDL